MASPSGGNAEPYSLSFVKKMALLFIPANLPIILANGKDHPSLCVAAGALALYLGKLTVNGDTVTAASSFSAATESRALASLVTTSTENRIVRMSMGSMHLLGAILYTLRTTKQGKEGDASSSSLFGTATEWGLTVAMCLVAGVWLSSGWYGQ